MPRLLAIVFSVLALAAVFLFTGPPQPAPANAQGARCYANSDCPDNLWCNIAAGGRCMSQCRENRDCGPGQRCVIDPNTIGRCALEQPSGPLPPDAAYCTSRRDCTSGNCNSSQQCGG